MSVQMFAQTSDIPSTKNDIQPFSHVSHCFFENTSVHVKSPIKMFASFSVPHGILISLKQDCHMVPFSANKYTMKVLQAICFFQLLECALHQSFPLRLAKFTQQMSKFEGPKQ